MARVMVDTYLRAHKGQVPEQVWLKRQQEWTYAESERGWARTLHAIAATSNPRECIFLAVDTSAQPGQEEVIGVVMGGPSDVGPWEHAGDIYALYVRYNHHRRGVGRRLLHAAVSYLARLGMTALTIRSLPANAAANRFYESLGGMPVGECQKEEYGYSITERIYGWADSSVLLRRAEASGE
jgi:ribosomal protein S18 acetylase RimI-like enzyme